jgi:hypothetical protein
MVCDKVGNVWSCCRLQAQPLNAADRYKGMGDVFKRTLEHEGVHGFYKGLLPNLLKVVPAASITYLVYEEMHLTWVWNPPTPRICHSCVYSLYKCFSNEVESGTNMRRTCFKRNHRRCQPATQDVGEISVGAIESCKSCDIQLTD